jgi:hypothetical protein
VMSSAARVVGADALVSKASFGELVLTLRRLIENRGGSAGLTPGAVGSGVTLQNWMPQKGGETESLRQGTRRKH